MSHLLRLLDELVREMRCVDVEGASSDTEVVGGGAAKQLRSVSLASMRPVLLWLIVRAAETWCRLRTAGLLELGDLEAASRFTG